MPHSTTLKDSATQLLIKDKSGALVTQYQSGHQVKFFSFNQRENLKNIEHALISDVYFTSNQARDKEHHRDEHLWLSFKIQEDTSLSSFFLLLNLKIFSQLWVLLPSQSRWPWPRWLFSSWMISKMFSLFFHLLRERPWASWLWVIERRSVPARADQVDAQADLELYKIRRYWCLNS